MEPRPTNSELEILDALWEHGACSVRQVHERLSLRKPVGYTTVLKLMQIMADKGLVIRDTADRAHVYRPGVDRSVTRQGLVDDLITRAFRGSAVQLAMHALGSKKASAEDLAEIRKLLDEMEDRS